MPLLNEFYPEYIERFSSDTRMIIDASDYKVERRRHHITSHLCPFSGIEIVDLTSSIPWTKYTYQMKHMRNHSNRIIKILIWIYYSIESLIFLLTFPISFPIFYILDYFHIINDFYIDGGFFCYYFFRYLISFIIDYLFPENKSLTITFMIPYIKFVNYPQVHGWRWWLWDLAKPEPSPFVKTISREIYKTWNGEALINFKWNLYGFNYYIFIWIMFTALLGCFSAAATLSDSDISEDVRNRLLIASIVLGFIHLFFEFRQLIYDSKEWIFDAWNYFGENKMI
jgi:hypothetical protein